MLDLFLQGGPLFMGILSVILIALLIVLIRTLMNDKTKEKIFYAMQWIRSLATLGLVVGILGQLIGLYSAFSAMESGMGISSEILAGGLRVSMIPTMYGFFIFIAGILSNMTLGRFL